MSSTWCVLYIYKYFSFSSDKDEDPKWEELLSHSLGLKYLLAGTNKQCQTKACFQILFSCITLLCFNLEPEIILLPVALFHAENFDLGFNSFSKMSAWELLYTGSEKGKDPFDSPWRECSRIASRPENVLVPRSSSTCVALVFRIPLLWDNGKQDEIALVTCWTFLMNTFYCQSCMCGF